MLGFSLMDIGIVVAVSLVICVTVCTLAMEAAVLFTPSFLYLFPYITSQFPALSPNAAIGLALVIEAFGYTSSVLGYWYRKQILWWVVGWALVLTVPFALGLRLVSYLVRPEGLMVVFGMLLFILAVLLLRVGHPDAGPMSSDPSVVLVLDIRDRIISAAAGACAGLVGIAIGEIMNTLLLIRKRIPIWQSVGTSAAILHLTILNATLFNLLILAWKPAGLRAETITIPWNVAAFIIPTVMVGGQIGAYLNSRLPAQTIHHALVGVYGLVGLFVLGQAAGHLLKGM